MEYILSLSYLSLFLFILKKSKAFQLPDFSKTWIYAAFLAKVLMGFAFYFIYTYYYTDRATSDIYKYFDDSLYIFEALKEKPLDYLQMVTGCYADEEYFKEHYLQKTNHWYKIQESFVFYNDFRFLIKLNAVLRLFSMGNYLVHSVILNFFSFWGFVLLFKAGSHFLASVIQKKVWFALLFFSPSLLFWTSGVLKESLQFIAIGALFYSINQERWKMKLLLFVPSLLFLFFIKAYFIWIILPFLVGSLLCKKDDNFSPIRYSIYSFAILIVLILAAEFAFGWSIPNILSNKFQEFYALGISQQSGSLVNNINIDSNYLSIIKNIPNALLNVFVMPLPLNAENVFALFFSLENLLYLAILIFAIAKVKAGTNFTLVLFLSFCILSLAMLIGLTTPILGAVARYKVLFLPFLFLLIAYLFNYTFSKNEKI